MKRTSLLGVLLICLLFGTASAVTRNVPSEYGTIQAGINASEDGDVVVVWPGVYFERINFNGKDITVTSTDPNDPRELYLAGRLEGRLGLGRFELASRIEPDFAWALHGRAWMTYQGGNPRGARSLGQQALVRARNPWEVATFSIALARYELALDRAGTATSTLASALEEPGLTEEDRTELRVWLARTELAADEPGDAERGFWRGILLLRESDLTRREALDLGASLLAAAERIRMPTALDEIEAALAARSGPGRDELRARILVQRGAPALARGILERVGGEEDPVSLESPYLVRIATGDAPGAVEDWLASLPGQALDGRHLGAVGLHGQHQAGARRPAFDEHGARAAGAVLAADVRAGQGQLVPQEIRQGHPRLDESLVDDAVDRHANRSRCRHLQ